jgi:hypothetical protein
MAAPPHEGAPLHVWGRRPTGALVQVPIPTAHYTGSGFVATVCPNGSDATATPPVCVLEAGSSVLASLTASALPLVQAALATGAEAQLVAAVSPQLCLTPPCPTWAVDDAGICRVSLGGACVARGVDPGTDLLIIPACGP